VTCSQSACLDPPLPWVSEQVAYDDLRVLRLDHGHGEALGQAAVTRGPREHCGSSCPWQMCERTSGSWDTATLSGGSGAG
jgi:hypothetical protein